MKPMWSKAVFEEMRALEKNNTSEITYLPAGKKTVGCKWIFKIKYNADRSIARHKARLVAKRFTQTHGIRAHTHHYVLDRHVGHTIISCKLHALDFWA